MTLLKNDILGVVLAGGQSTRMAKQDKATIQLANGYTMVEHAYTRLSAQGLECIINTNAPRDCFSNLSDVVMIKDNISGYIGPLAGILAGLNYAASLGKKAIITVAVDTPFFPVDLVDRLGNTFSKIAIAKSSTGSSDYNLQPIFGFWPVSLQQELKQAIENNTRKVMAFVKCYDWVEIEWKTDRFDYFFNVNTPKDIEYLNKYLTQQDLL